MKPAVYPFSAIVGQNQMKLALLLAAVDWRLGVLLRGEKGAGKTTADWLLFSRSLRRSSTCRSALQRIVFSAGCTWNGR